MTIEEASFLSILNSSLAEYHKLSIKNGANITNGSKRNFTLKRVFHSLKALLDLVILLCKICRNSKLKLRVYYTHSSFVRVDKGKFEDILYKGLLAKTNSVIIIYNRDTYYDNISGVKAYNFGLLVRVLEIFSRLFLMKRTQGSLGEWMVVNSLIVKRLCGNEIFIPSYSNDLGLSLVFNRYRKNYKLIEVQHTSVINYPPYSIVANVKLVDAFYYRDKNSLDFVKKNIFRNFPVDYHRIEANEKVVLQDNVHRNEILYISSFEYSDVHPTFISYLSQFPNDYYIKIRLHPRQLHSKVNFARTLAQLGCNFEFQESKDWFEDIGKNCIVVSILSSIVEESVGVGLKTIIVDELGAKRFDYLIDNKLCFFSNKLADIFNAQ